MLAVMRENMIDSVLLKLIGQHINQKICNFQFLIELMKSL